MDNIFIQIGLMFVIASFGAYLAKLLKQPLIPVYILTGLILGPIFGFITNTSVIRTLSEIGIAFLLFIVGLELDVKKLKDIGNVASVGGMIQIALVFAFGFLAAHLLGFVNLEGVYIGLIAALSSTMVVIKLLSDKRQLDTLHGRVVIGILLMQDIVAILALSFLISTDGFSIFSIIIAVAKGLSVLLVAILSSKFLFPSLFRFAAKTQELLLLTSLGVCFFFSLVFYLVGFSIAIGAFIAGVALANLPYSFEIESRIRPLRDFFVTLFFVSLGLELVFEGFANLVWPLIVITLIVILAKPLVIMFLCGFFGYARRTSFMTSLSLAQVSEFSLIIAAQGLILGHISNNIFSLAILLAIITISLTSYLIKFDDRIYSFFSKYIKFFDVMSRGETLQYIPQEMKYDVILCGDDRIGYNVFKTLNDMKKSFIVVDFNPDIIKNLVKRKIPCMYGDIGDVEILERLNLKETKLIISTIPHLNDNLLIIKKTKQVNEKAVIFVTAETVEDALKLYETGADYVILPHFLGGQHVSLLLQETTENLQKVIKNKFRHIEELKDRLEIGHRMPIK